VCFAADDALPLSQLLMMMMMMIQVFREHGYCFFFLVFVIHLSSLPYRRSSRSVQ
jgi:hypothetical protein